MKLLPLVLITHIRYKLIDKNIEIIPVHQKVSLWLLCFYGLGNILGAGIYVLIGKVDRNAGYFTLLSFFIAGLVASFTAFSHAELSSRFPVAATD